MTLDRVGVADGHNKANVTINIQHIDILKLGSSFIFCSVSSMNIARR